MAELFKFRCYQCQKLIGAPPSRFGSVVKCPKCGAELIVPSPDDESTTEEPPAFEGFRPEDLGLKLNLRFEPLSGTPPTPKAPPDPVGPDPIAFLSQTTDTDDFPNPDLPPSPADDKSPGDPPELPEPEVDSLVDRRRGRRSLDPTSRSRDVVLPRTAALAWSLFAILALGFAFTAGLLIGQRFGK